MEVDANRLVAASGFIDLHQHSQTPEAYRLKALDGVTTALELEVGTSPVSEWYAARHGKSLIHFGTSAGHIPTLERYRVCWFSILSAERSSTQRPPLNRNVLRY
jgi:hypothetical protein